MKKPTITSYVLLALFILFSVITWNVEFMIYAAILLPLVILIHKGDAHFNFKEGALWGFDIWILLHLLGGMASWHGTRFYDYILLPIIGEPYFILRYDQVVHFYCYVVFSVLIGSIVMHVMQKKANPWLIGAIIAFTALGVGAFNEIIEFLPVVLINSPGPGGYINTALDLVANMLGAVFGTWLFLRER